MMLSHILKKTPTAVSLVVKKNCKWMKARLGQEFIKAFIANKPIRGQR